MGNQNPLRRCVSRWKRAADASDEFAKRYMVGVFTLGYGILFGGGAVMGWLYRADPGYYFYTGGSDWMAMASRTVTDPLAWAPGLFSIAAVIAFTLYVTPSEQRVRTLESDV